MSRYDDRDHYRRKDEFYRRQDRRYQNYQDDLSYERKRRERESELGWQALRGGDTMRALSHIGGADLALRYAELSESPSTLLPAKKRLEFKRLQLFESGAYLDHPSLRQYTWRFPKSTTRNVCFELDMKNLWEFVEYECEIVARYDKGDGTFMRQLEHKMAVKPEWNTFWFANGRGWAEPGNWAVGLYRVEVFIDREKVTEDSFSIYDDELQKLMNDYNKAFAELEKVTRDFFKS